MIERGHDEPRHVHSETSLVPASPDRPNGQAEHTVADLIEAGRSLHRAGRLEDAERLYAQALAEDADCAEAHELMAVLAGQRSQFDAAIAGFRRAVALAGLTPQRCYNLAEAHRLAGDFPSAVAAYNQALALDAGFFDAYRDCADAAKDEAAKARAAGENEAAARFDKLAAHYLKGLALALFRAERQAETVAAYREAISLDPESADLHHMLGVELDNQRLLPEAEAAFRRAIELDPTAASYLNNLGVVLARQGRNDEAAELFRRALAIDPEFEDAQTNLSGLK